MKIRLKCVAHNIKNTNKYGKNEVEYPINHKKEYRHENQRKKLYITNGPEDMF